MLRRSWIPAGAVGFVLAAAVLLPAAPAPMRKRSATVSFVNSIGMKLVYLAAGKFIMGSPREEVGRYNEEDKHEVEISRSFHLGAFEVTQEEYRKVMGHNPSHYVRNKGTVGDVDTSRCPVESVSWHDAVEFCKKLSARREESRAGRVYRLPTEAEWEYACRAGTRTAYAFGLTLERTQANFASALPRTTPAGTYKANAWGLYDMHGNVWEWCQDWYDTGYYRRSPGKDPPGPAEGRERARRGGARYSNPGFCRSALRFSALPTLRDCDIGFRVACDVR
jgi:formylglycine-generating enzyme required for sulfatase activity